MSPPQLTLRTVKNYKDSQTSHLHVQFNSKPHTNHFVSKSSRFNYQQETKPGPGAYEPSPTFQQPKKTTEKTEPMSVRKDLQWIISNCREPFMTGYKPTTIGPGSYNPKPVNKKLEHQSSWQKSNRFDYTKRQAQSIQMIPPGPGSYELGKKEHKFKPGLSSFVSKSPKSLMSSLKQELASVNLSRTHLEENTQMILDPEIEEIEKLATINSKESPQKKKEKLTSIFASKSPRYELINSSSNTKLGPGSYQADSTQKKEGPRSKFPKLTALTEVEYKVKQPRQKQPRKPSPGPGDYQVKDQITQKDHIASSISQQPRFAEKSSEIPGPGSYSKNKYIFVTQGQDSKKYFHNGNSNSTDKNRDVSFLTSSCRTNLILPSKENPFGEYNLHQFDMQYKLGKKVEYLHKLKIMEVETAPFNTKSKRELKI